MSLPRLISKSLNIDFLIFTDAEPEAQSRNIIYLRLSSLIFEKERIPSQGHSVDDWLDEDRR